MEITNLPPVLIRNNPGYLIRPAPVEGKYVCLLAHEDSYVVVRVDPQEMWRKGERPPFAYYKPLRSPACELTLTAEYPEW